METAKTESILRRRGSHASKSLSELPLTNQDVESLLTLESESRVNKKSIPASSSFTLISVLVLIGVSLLFVKYMDNRLPTPLNEDDILENPHSFIEERARKDLHDLTQIGVRISGSFETGHITVDMFLKILEKIANNKLNVHNIEYEVQRPTGAFYMDSDEGHTSTYANIANVVGKIEPSDLSQRKGDSVLFNCHFDTKPGSPGATDNMISCASMLEVLRVLSQEEVALQNTIVFLFNGAEELGLQGAHAFILGNTSEGEFGHRWSKDVRTFVNLEGAGAGGREILFQTGPGNSWLLNGYSSSVPYPYGLAMAEEAFQRGLIPSDTDFRIFRDFGKIPGLDMAFIKNGWVYHTKWDKLSEIPPGSIQHMGANALALAKHFGNLDFSKIEDSKGKMVFFDVLGAFMIKYSETVGIIINLLVAFISLASIYWFEIHKKFKLFHILWLPVATILAWGCGILAAVIVAYFLNGCGYFKPFYSYPSLALILFGVPSVLAEVIAYSFAFKGSPEKAWISGKVTFAIIIIALTFVTRVVYVFTINLLFGVVGWFLSRWFCRGWPKAILITYLVIGELIPFILSSYLVFTLSDVFVPIMGRSGSETNANLFFGLILAGTVSVLVFNGMAAIFVSFKKSILITTLVISILIINPAIVFGFLGKIPYGEKTPMRLNIVDLDRTWYKSDLTTVNHTESGYWFWPLDSNTKQFLPTFAKTVYEVENATSVEIRANSCIDLYCAQPFLWPTSEIIKTTHWISKGDEGLPSSLKDTVIMTTTETQLNSSSLRQISFSFIGSTEITVVLSPGPNYKLSNWSLTPEALPPSGTKWQNRDTYFIYHARGVDPHPFQFTCDFERVPESDSEPGSPLVDIQFSSFYLYGSQLMSENFADFTSRFPSWSHVMSWTTVMKIFTIY